MAGSQGYSRAEIATIHADLGKEVNVGLRPEDLILTDDAPTLTGKVDLVEALGEVTLLYLPGKGGKQLVAKLPGIHDGLTGQEVRLGIAPEKVQIFHRGQSLRH